MFHRRSDSRGESKGNDFEGGSSDTDQEWELEDITEASVPPATEGEFDSNTVGAQEERIIEGAEIESGSEDEGNAARGKAGRKATKEADANLRRFLERQSHFQEQRAARVSCWQFTCGIVFPLLLICMPSCWKQLVASTAN